MTIRDALRDKNPRVCPFCGEEWPLFTPHLCATEREVKHPESLANLIQGIIGDMTVDVKTEAGDVDIAGSVAYILAQPIADQLALRRITLMGALVRDDVLEQVPDSRAGTPILWRFADE